MPKTVQEQKVKAEADDEWVKGELILKNYKTESTQIKVSWPIIVEGAIYFLGVFRNHDGNVNNKHISV